MAKVREAAKAECERMQDEYKITLDEINEEIKKIEDILITQKDTNEELETKIKLSLLCIKASSYLCTISALITEYMEIRGEGILNEARRNILKAIVLLEDTFGNHTDESLSFKDEVHEYLKDKITDVFKYRFICSIGYTIDYLKACYGDNSKWKWNFVEIEGRFSVVAKNIINYKTYLRDLNPNTEGYSYRVRLMNLVKLLLSKDANQYRMKYELTDKRIDDMKMALNIMASLRRISIYLNEVEEANEQKKIYDLWKKKLDDDLKKI